MFSHVGKILDFYLMVYSRSDLYDLYDLAHVAGWEPCILHDPGHIYWAQSALHRSCMTYHNGKLGYR